MHKVVVKTSEKVISVSTAIHEVQGGYSGEVGDKGVVASIRGYVHLLRDMRQKTHEAIMHTSRVLLVLNSNNHLLEYLKQRIDEVQNLDIIYHQMANHSYQCLVVVFKSLTMAEQTYDFLWDMSQTKQYILPLYLQSVRIMCSTAPDYQEMKGKWKQLPTCIDCLQVLDSEVTELPLLPQLKEECHFQCQVCVLRKKSHLPCYQCGEKDETWICLLCGAVGCGRYKNADAQKHYQATLHCFSLDLTTHSVWDYDSDCFCHRVLSKDTIIFQVMQSQQEINQRGIEKAFWEYCSVVSEQLDKQRVFYEQIKKSEQQKFQQGIQELDQRQIELLKEKEEKADILKSLNKRNKKLEKKNKELREKASEQRQINEHLQDILRGNQSQNHEIEIRKRQLNKIQKQISDILTKLS